MKSKAANDRVEIIQSLLDARPDPSYLEIGVQSGDSFFQLKAGKKIAVDPRFLFTTMDKLNWIRWNISNLRNSYFEMTSDAFFAEHAGMLASKPLDVVFVDGLHTHEQSLRDIENSLPYLRPGGVIVVDDCMPPNEAGSHPIKPQNNDPWCGDVWKTILHLRSARPDLRTFVVDCAYGLGIVTKQPAESTIRLTADELAQMKYEDFHRDRVRLLDLQPKEYFFRLMRSCERSPG